jgi:hypothetical protein
VILDRPASWAIERGKALLDEAVPPDRLREFLIQALGRSEGALAAGELSYNDELARARALASKIGLLPAAESAAIPPLARMLISLADAEARIALAPNGKVVGRGGLLAGAGAALQTVLEHPESRCSPALDAALEALLRNVETRRRDGLRISQGGEQADRWMEWLSIAVLFSRASRRRQDLRLLNAALKLNDWAFPAHRRLPAGPRLARYALSLAEGETAAAEGLA